MDRFTSADDLMVFCERAWRSDAKPELLERMALSQHRPGDFELDEIEAFDDRGFLGELFQVSPWDASSSMYDVLGEYRYAFPSAFPLFRVIAAAHPNTPASTLRYLVHDDDPEVLWAVISNPSVDFHQLSHIWEPSVVIASGIQELADPQLDDREPNGLRFGTGNPWELENVHVSVAMAGSRFSPLELLDEFCESDFGDQIKALILRNGQRLNITQWEALLAGASRRDRQSRGWMQWLAMSPDLPSRFVETILGNAEEGVILARRLATSPLTSALELRMIVNSISDVWTRVRIAHHPNISLDALRILAVDPSSEVRQAVETSPEVTEAIRAAARMSL